MKSPQDVLRIPFAPCSKEGSGRFPVADRLRTAGKLWTTDG